jgi:hypothetical protein
MKNQVWANQQPARSLPVPAGTKSGDPVKVGDLVGVAATDRADSTTKPLPTGGVGHANGYAAVNVDGGYLLDVDGAIGGPGTPIYLTGAGPFTLTTTASGNTLFGQSVPGPDNTYLSKAAGVGEAVVQVKAQI